MIYRAIKVIQNKKILNSIDIMRPFINGLSNWKNQIILEKKKFNIIINATGLSNRKAQVRLKFFLKNH